jgi:hypothetical protein
MVSAKLKLLLVSLITVAALQSTTLRAQQPQIPTLQVCNPTEVHAEHARVTLQGRGGAYFSVQMTASCNPGEYPTGGGSIYIDPSMSDTIIYAKIDLVTLEQITTTGNDTPTAYFNGRCGEIPGCRFWMMMVDNKPNERPGTPDVVGFLIFDGNGNRIAYGTGPLDDGDIRVKSNSSF